jgi:CRP-like cAMP-binding protein
MEEEKVKQIQQNEENNNNFSDKRIKEGNKLNENKISSSIDKVTLKIKPIFEILKLKEKDFKNLENILEDVDKLYKIYKSMINSEKSDCIINKQKNIDIYEIIEKMKIPPEKRTMDDIYLIRKYIKTTKIESLFYNEIKIKGKLYNSCLLFFSMLFRFRFIQKGKILFRIGEQPDFFYLILEGKINILKPIPKIKTLSGHEYFLQLMEYRKNKENHLYSLCILENILNFEIKKKDKDLIPYIYLIYRLKEIRKRKFVDFTNIFNLIGISPIDLGLNPEKVHSIGYIYKQSKQMRLRMPIITEEDLNKYKFIDDKENKKEVTIFEYENFLILDKNKYFGEHSYLGKSVRNATIKTEENCYLGYLDINLYNLNFFVAKKAIYDKKVNFLHSSFIFGKIDAKRFERKYFNFFISEKYENNDYIFNENSPCNYTYFIEEGTKKIYIQDSFKGNKVFKDKSFWEEFLCYSINKEIMKTLNLDQKIQEDKENSDYKFSNVVFAQILTLIDNMFEFDLDCETIKDVLNPKISVYKLNDNFKETINDVILAKQEQKNLEMEQINKEKEENKKKEEN